MNVTPKVLINGLITALGAYSWPVLGTAPTVLKGAQVAIAATGNVVIVAPSTYGPELVGIGNNSRMEHVVEMVGLVPWADTDANADLQMDMFDELRSVIKTNRQIAGVGLLKFKAAEFLAGRIFGPNTQQYRGVKFTLAAKDVESP